MVQSTVNNAAVSSGRELFQLHKVVQPLDAETFKAIKPHIKNGVLYLSREPELINKINVVDKGTLLLQYINAETLAKKEQSERMHIKSNLIQLKRNPNKAENRIIQDGENFYADVNGLFVYYDLTVRMIEIFLDADIDLRITDDNIKVIADLYPAIKRGKDIELNDILLKLADLKVSAGVNEKRIVDILKGFNQNRKIIRDLELASGSLPVNGKDGWIEYKVSLTKDLAVKVNEKGKLDFHGITSVTTVAKDQELAVVHPPELGIDGFDVHGKVLKSKPGNAVNISVGPNTYKALDGNQKIFASIDGFLKEYGNGFEVNERYIINGDIDYGSGNIVCKGSLKVRGDVNRDFVLNLSKDIEVDGCVSDALLEAGENVVIGGGFSGNGDGVIKAGGNIDVKYVRNQTIYCRGTFTFKRDLIDSNLYVKGKVAGNSSQATIMGGRIIAGEGVDVTTIGNEYALPTIIEVGYDYEFSSRIEELYSASKELTKQIENIDKIIVKYANFKRCGTAQIEELKKQAAVRAELKAELDEIHEKAEALKQQISKPSNAVVKVSRIVYPGVQIIINNRIFKVTEPLNAKTFMLNENDEVIYS
ncbi:MAG: DUF342 domain-containing protein [Melioribacteraceae bacterium]|nr:DUF342 domain-containing protein [Melioribacteraceae bacterium]